MSCFGYVWSVVFGGTISVNEGTYHIVKRIGEGGFSYVDLVNRQGHNYALKRLLLQLPEQHEAVEKEIRAHQTVQHRNVLRLVDHEIRDLRRGGGTGLLLFPYYQNGTLQDLIVQAQRSNHPLPEHRILRLLVSACDGLEAMHCCNLAHRDIKPSNMLLTDSWDELVLMDLGSAASAECTITSRNTWFAQLCLLRSLHPCYRREALALQELCAQTCSAQYRAPELFEVPSNCTITAKTDVWSLGCSLYAAAFGQSPCDGSALAAISGRITFPKQHSYSREFCDVVQWLLCVDPSARPSVAEVRERLSLLLTHHDSN